VVLYIRLLNEGVDVVRPTTGIVVGPDTIQVLPTPDYDPADEEWEFPPGTKVRCVREVWEGRELLVARHGIT
jgi:hypothetical protein